MAKPGKYKARIWGAGAVSILIQPRGCAVRQLGVKPDEFKWIPPAGCLGDKVWVRETWATMTGNGIRVVHRADDSVNDLLNGHAVKWSNPRYMPRWACRLELTIASAKLQRLHDITEEDAIAEGVRLPYNPGGTRYEGQHRDLYSRLWDDLNYRRAPWAVDPWVWAYTFSDPQIVTPRVP